MPRNFNFAVIDHRSTELTATLVRNEPSFMAAAISVFGDMVAMSPADNTVQSVFEPGTGHLLGTVERITHPID